MTSSRSFSRSFSKFLPYTTPVCKQNPKFTSRAGLVILLTPFDMISSYLFGPKIPSFKSSNVYLFIVIDEFSRFPFAFPIKNITAKTIIRCLTNVFDILEIQGLSTNVVEDNWRCKILVFSAQKGEFPNPVHRRTTLKATGKTNVTLELSGRLLVAFWIPENFHRTTGKLLLAEASCSVRVLLCTS